MSLNPRLSALSPRSNRGRAEDPPMVRTRSVHLPPWLPEFLLTEGILRELMPWVAILLWYAFNLTVIFINKQIFIHYPFPTALALMTELVGFAITTVCLRLGVGTGNLTSQSAALKMTISQRIASVLPIALSVSGNNFFSNLAIQHSSVATSQTLKAIVPVFTLGIYSVIHKRHYGWPHLSAVGLVCGGVLVATATDNSLTIVGGSAGAMAAVCSAFKVVFANAQTKRLTPIEASNAMGPFNILILGSLFYFKESAELISSPLLYSMLTPRTLGLCLAHGFLVFGLQQAGTFSTAVNSPVIQATAGNMKLVLVYGLSWLIYGESLSACKQVGCILTLAGGLWYSFLQQGFQSLGQVFQAFSTCRKYL